MTVPNWKIFLAISLSLFILFGINYFYKNPQIIRPENIYASISQKTEELKVKISSIRLPDFSSLFSFKLTIPNNNMPIKQSNNDTNHSFSLFFPTASQQNNYPTPTYAVAFPTSKPPTYPTTYRPAPTTKPQPTAIPTSPPPPIGNVRPGSSIQEIANMTQKYSCTPAALILAVKYLETGSSFFNSDAATIKKYNTYNWWNNVSSVNEICQGYGYDVISGLIPSNSKFAGEKCANPLGDQSYTGKPMGIMGLSDFESDTNNTYIQRIKTAANVTTALDRRVLFDAMVYAGVHFKNISLERDDNCSNWDLKYIAKVACKYQGGCNFQYTVGSNRSGNYCYLLCEKYNEYAGTSYDCNLAASYVDASCNFK